MNNVELRSAVPEDGKKLLDIYSHYVLNTAVTMEWSVPSVKEFEDRIRNTLKKYPYIVLEENDEIKGYAYASPFKTRQGYMYCAETSIYVKHGCAKNGYGRCLLSRLEKEMKTCGIKKCYACITFPDSDDEYLNRNSMNFHEHMGYSTVGVFKGSAYKFGRKYNMVYMEKQLSEKE